MRICEGIAAQKRIDTLGVRSRPLMSIDKMQKVAKVSSKDECPSSALHDEGTEGLRAWDDLSGQELDPKLMMAARREEISYFKEMGVYEKVDIAESWKETGRAPIAVRWVDINKGDSKSPKYRSRLVAKEFNTGVRPELYAATPPSECLRLMLSLLASGRKQGYSLVYADVSRAYFYAKAVRPVYVKLPEEDLEPGDENKCGRLKMSMYGTRDAALNWSLEYGDTLRAAGYVQGRANPCLFSHGELGVSVMVHGDDFIAVGPDKNLQSTVKTLEDKYRLKTEKLGCNVSAGESSEIRILNKVVRMTGDGVELEADPRHAELVIKELGLQGAKASPVPGAKDESRKSRGSTPESRRAERQVDSIGNAKKSAGDEVWDTEHFDEITPEGDEQDELLGPEEARIYRGVAARLNYIAPDRCDISYAVKESARCMSAPTVAGLQRLKKIGKYLIGKPRLVSYFQWQDMPTRVTTFTDSDWAGCNRTAKSTSGGAVCLGEHVLKTYCKQQKVVALSSAEAELYAMVAASAETLAIAAYAGDLGLKLDCELYCDSSAALGIAQRAGIGKVRHLRTQGLWVQEVRVSGRIVYRKVLGAKNPADLMTKHMPAELSGQHVKTLNMRLVEGRAESAPTLDSVESLVQGWYEDIIDPEGSEHVDKDHEGEVESQEEMPRRPRSMVTSTCSEAPGVEPNPAVKRLDTSVRWNELDRRNVLERRNVSFNRRVQMRPVPAEGKGKRTPARGARSALLSKRGPADGAAPARPADIVDITSSRIFGIEGVATRANGMRWADVDIASCEAERAAPKAEVRARRSGHSVAGHSSAQAYSSGMFDNHRTADKASAVLKSRVAGNVRIPLRCAESASPWRLTVADRMAGRKLESCGPRSGLHANARTVNPARDEILFCNQASSPRASSAAGGAQNMHSRVAGRDMGMRIRWTRHAHRQMDCQSRRCTLGLTSVQCHLREL